MLETVELTGACNLNPPSSNALSYTPRYEPPNWLLGPSLPGYQDEGASTVPASVCLMHTLGEERA